MPAGKPYTAGAYQRKLKQLEKAAKRATHRAGGNKKAKSAIAAFKKTRSKYYGSNPSDRAVRKVAKAGKKLVKAAAGTPGRLLGAADKAISKGVRSVRKGVSSANKAASASGRTQKLQAVRQAEKYLKRVKNKKGAGSKATLRAAEARLRKTKATALSVFKPAAKKVAKMPAKKVSSSAGVRSARRGDSPSKVLSTVRSSGLARGRAASSAGGPAPTNAAARLQKLRLLGNKAKKKKASKKKTAKRKTTSRGKQNKMIRYGLN